MQIRAGAIPIWGFWFWVYTLFLILILKTINWNALCSFRIENIYYSFIFILFHSYIFLLRRSYFSYFSWCVLRLFIGDWVEALLRCHTTTSVSCSLFMMWFCFGATLKLVNESKNRNDNSGLMWRPKTFIEDQKKNQLINQIHPATNPSP